ncbi:vegetative incompatibility protein HET-E-1 [Corynascus novoguineensis]|uniref:Vegetative incompatibility protein HET-E-1 n=1 Tax=Corynascus novoguineensis TaxID=1126955 RepID=A0AAN7CLB8_9PEZI|nr:vegetative incompatibility protein HET-E-1 [Corynascus novoguineensis]
MMRARSTFSRSRVFGQGAVHVLSRAMPRSRAVGTDDKDFLDVYESIQILDFRVTRIEQTKGGLLVDSYRWVLDNTDFRRWRDDGPSRLLWIKGDPGNETTMLLCGIINELKAAPNSSLLSSSFCQSTDANINNATAILHSLIYLLVDQKPSLISHVQKKYDAMGNPLFRDVNVWVALSEIFTDILKYSSLPSTRLIVDALDECIEGLDKLLELVVRTSSKVRLPLEIN